MKQLEGASIPLIPGCAVLQILAKTGGASNPDGDSRAETGLDYWKALRFLAVRRRDGKLELKRRRWRFDSWRVETGGGGLAARRPGTGDWRWPGLGFRRRRVAYSEWNRNEASLV
jgi:hypothetical protein